MALGLTLACHNVWLFSVLVCVCKYIAFAVMDSFEKRELRKRARVWVNGCFAALFIAIAIGRVR